MAELIDALPARTRESNYNWDELLDGNPRVLTQEVDFPDAKPTTFGNLARTTAKKRGLKVKIVTVDSNRIAMQAFEPQTDEADDAEATHAE